MINLTCLTKNYFPIYFRSSGGGAGGRVGKPGRGGRGEKRGGGRGRGARGGGRGGKKESTGPPPTQEVIFRGFFDCKAGQLRSLTRQERSWIFFFSIML